MKKVLLSIKPKYVKQILDGNKKWEFRKQIWNSEIDKILIYSSYPEKKFVAVFSPGKILFEEPHEIWNKCNTAAGLKQEEYFQYTEGRLAIFAIEITNLEVFKTPFRLPEFMGPQNFRYYDDNLFGGLKNFLPQIL